MKTIEGGSDLQIAAAFLLLCKHFMNVPLLVSQKISYNIRNSTQTTLFF